MILEDLVVSIMGGVLVLSGYAIRYWVGRRRFYRRGLGGLQHYSSYSRSLMVSTMERFANFLSIPLILLGIFLIVAWWMYVREVGLSNSRDEDKNKTEHKADSRAHFLVLAEKGSGKMQINLIPKTSFPLSMKSLV